MVSILGHGIFAIALFWLFQGEWSESGGSLNNTAVDVIELTMSTEELLAQVPEQVAEAVPEQAPDPQQETADATEAASLPPTESVPLEELTSLNEDTVENPSEAAGVRDAAPRKAQERPIPQTIPLEPLSEPQTQPDPSSAADLQTEPSPQRGFVNPLRNLGFGGRFRDRNLFPDGEDINDADTNDADTNNADTSDGDTPESSSSEPPTSEPAIAEQATGEAIAPNPPARSNESDEPSSAATGNQATDQTEPTDEPTEGPQPVAPPTGLSTETPLPSSGNPENSSPSPTPTRPSSPSLPDETGASNPESGPETSGSATSPSATSNPGSNSGDNATDSTGSANRPNGQIQQPGVFPIARTNAPTNTTDTNSSATAPPTPNPSANNPSANNSPANNPPTASGTASGATDDNRGQDNSTNRTIDGVEIRFSIDKTRAIYTGDFPDEDGYAQPRSDSGFQTFLCPETALVPAEDLNRTVELVLAVDRNGNLDTQAPTPLANWPGVYSLSSAQTVSDRYINAILCELQAQGFEPARQAGRTVAGILVVDVSIRGR